MEFNVQVGAKGSKKILVTQDKLAKSMASGAVEVFATPYLVAIMEGASVAALALPEGWTSVGTQVCVSHLAATPKGMEVEAKAVVTAVEGRKITFAVEAYDEKEKIGEGTHERFLVEEKRFTEKAYQKLQK